MSHTQQAACQAAFRTDASILGSMLGSIPGSYYVPRFGIVVRSSSTVANGYKEGSLFAMELVDWDT